MEVDKTLKRCLYIREDGESDIMIELLKRKGVDL